MSAKQTHIACYPGPIQREGLDIEALCNFIVYKAQFKEAFYELDPKELRKRLNSLTTCPKCIRAYDALEEAGKVPQPAWVYLIAPESSKRKGWRGAEEGEVA